MRQRWWQFLLVSTFAALVLSGCSGDPTLNALDPQGTAGEKSLNLIYISFMIMMGVFAVVISIFVYVLVKFRKRKGKDVMPEQVHGSTKLEIIWTVIPIAILAALAVPTVRYTFDLAEKPTGNDVVNINVTGHQYWWEFEYPDEGFTTAQEMVIPVGKKVHLTINGKDVLHSFWVPALAGKMDVVPGKVNTMWLDAKKPGTYQGKCAELCGAGHALMDFKVYAKSDADYEKWLATMKSSPADVQTATAKEGEKLFKQNCLSCHAGQNPSYEAPDLTKFDTRTTIAGIKEKNRENLESWLKNPAAIKPGTKMPSFDYLNEQELDSLMDYLESRK